MDKSKSIMFFMFIGSTLGGIIPNLWNAELFSLSSVFLSAVGGFAGIWLGYKLGQ